MKVSTQHYINGNNVKDMTKSDCIEVIRSAEADVATLEAIDTESEAVTKEIASIRQFIKDVVSHLDSKK